jgi:hypothetical protein
LVTKQEQYNISAYLLTTLKLSGARKSNQVPQVMQRKNKLAKRVWQQIELAKAQAQGTQFRVAMFKSYTDTATGVRQQMETHVSVKPWQITTQAGKLVISVRYGSPRVRLAKGKYAVEVAAETDLIKTLDVIKAAVLSGELDAQIDAAATKLRASFMK